MQVGVHATGAGPHEHDVALADPHAVECLCSIQILRHDRGAQRKRSALTLATSSSPPRPTIRVAATCSMPNLVAPPSVTLSIEKPLYIPCLPPGVKI